MENNIEYIINPIGISVEEAAKLLGVSKPKLYQLMKRDDFPVYKSGGRVIISYEGLRIWMLKMVNYNEYFEIDTNNIDNKTVNRV